jgi:hypothetical protein
LCCLNSKANGKRNQDGPGRSEKPEPGTFLVFGKEASDHDIPAGGVGNIQYIPTPKRFEIQAVGLQPRSSKYYQTDRPEGTEFVMYFLLTLRYDNSVNRIQRNDFPTMITTIFRD